VLKVKPIIYLILIFKSIQIFLAYLNPYEYYPVRTEVLFYFVAEILAFLLVTLLIKPIYKVENNICDYRFFISNLEKLYIVPAIIFLFFMFYIKIKLNLSLQGLRDYFYFSEGIINFKAINTFIFIYHALGFFLLINNIINNNIKKFMFISISLLIFDAAQGGRMYFYYILMLYSIYIFSSVNGPIKIKKENVVKYYLLLLLMSLTLSAIIMSRVDSGKLFETIYIYFIGPVFLYDNAIINEDILNIPDLRFGVSLMSIDWSIVGFLKVLGLELETLNTLLDPILKTGYFFSDDVGMNAHFTSGFYTYIDFGFIGFLYYPLLIYLLMLMNTRFFLFILILILFSSMISIREHFINSPIFIISIIIYFTGVKSDKKIINNYRYL
jgi:hypothetical protein